MTERPDLTTESTRVTTERTQPRRKPRTGPRLRDRVVDGATTAISLVATGVVIILSLHIIFVMFEANQSNAIVRTVNSWAETLAWQFKDVFAPSDPKISVLVNYAVAAMVYLIVGRVAAGLVRRMR